MRYHFDSCRFCLTFVLLVAVGQHAAAQLQQLETKVPATANAVAIVNVKAIQAHPALFGGKLYSSGMTQLPAGIEWYLAAAEMDYEYMQPLWEIAVAYMPEKLTMAQVAARSGGRPDRLAGSDAVERPNDSYVVSFGPRVIGAMSPANRQNVIRWVRESKVKMTPDFSPYLAGAVATAEQGPDQVMLAFELTGVFAPEEVAQALAESRAASDAGIDVDEAAKIIASIVGMRLDITLGDSHQGRLTLSFQEDPAPLVPAVQPLLVEILTKHGAKVEGLAKWTATGEPQAIVLAGELSPSGLRRVVSLLSGPVGPWSSTLPQNTAQTTTPESVMGQASQRYFQAVTGYLDDLFGGDVQPQSMYQARVWLERYTHQIEALDTTNVDPEVLSYASNVVMLLGEIGSVIQRTQFRSDLQESTVDDYGRSRYARYGVYGYYEKPDVARDIQVAQAGEAVRGLRSTQAIVSQLHQISAETRQAMTERYGLKF